MWIAQIILGLAYAAAIVVFVYGLPEHRGDPSHVSQSKLQSLQGASWAVGLCGLGLLLVIIPLGRREMWAWWGTIACALTVLGGYVGPHIRLHLPLARADRIGVNSLALVFSIGLAIARLALNER